MSMPALAGVMIVLMLALMVMRMPIALAMFIPGALGIGIVAGTDTLLAALKGTTMARLSVYELSIIPLFLFMGQLAVRGGLSQTLFDAAAALVGHLRGGLALASLMACAVFGSICGSSVATAATVTQVAYPEMRRRGYSGSIASATLATGGTLGILIPPSVPLVIYAVLAEQNITTLFLAAMIPALMALAGYMGVVALLAQRHRGMPAMPRASRAQRRATFQRVWPIVVIFAVMLGGLYSGAFTPTEAAAVGVGAVVIVTAASGTLSRFMLSAAVRATAETTALIFMIFMGADLLNTALALTQLPGELAQWVSHLPLGPLAILVAILVLYLLLSSVMDELSMIILTIPVIFPVIMGLDLWGLLPQEKAIWFGILTLMVVQFGLIAPPIGLNVIIVNGLVRDVPIAATYRGILPFLFTDGLRIVVLVIFPGCALALIPLMR
ncbi:MAG: TRAP transporter large permease [Burkholderiaceae bacterium]